MALETQSWTRKLFVNCSYPKLAIWVWIILIRVDFDTWYISLCTQLTIINHPCSIHLFCSFSRKYLVINCSILTSVNYCSIFFNLINCSSSCFALQCHDVCMTCFYLNLPNGLRWRLLNLDDWSGICSCGPSIGVSEHVVIRCICSIAQPADIFDSKSNSFC